MGLGLVAGIGAGSTFNLNIEKSEQMFILLPSLAQSTYHDLNCISLFLRLSLQSLIMASADETRKNRIISHMNNDHARELTHYLRHFAHLPATAASQPTMRNVDLQGMVISARGKEYTVAFTPPLESWAEVKTRIIEMDSIARENLGISDVYVTEYTPPEGMDIVVFVSVIFYYCCAAGLPWVVPGSQIWAGLTDFFPGGPRLFCWLVKTIFVPVLGIHLVECYFFNKKLHKHGIDKATSGGLWWKWQLDCFIEGFPSFNRVDRIVAKKVAEKNAKKQ